MSSQAKVFLIEYYFDIRHKRSQTYSMSTTTGQASITLKRTHEGTVFVKMFWSSHTWETTLHSPDVVCLPGWSTS